MEKAFYFLFGATVAYAVGRYLINQERNINKILKIVTMSQENLDLLLGRVSGLETSLTNIKEDITRIKDSLPAEGGLTAEEVATLSAALDSAVSKADTLDKENEPEPEPTPGL